MKDITILIPTVGEPTLEMVLESIRQQSNLNYSILGIDSSSDHVASDIFDKYGAQAIKTGSDVGLLEARYIGSRVCNSEYLLNLDATKALLENALPHLEEMKDRFDIIAILEKRQGEGRWTRLSQIDKTIVAEEKNLIREKELPQYIVPRFYKSQIFKEALSKLKDYLPDYIFKRILWPEDRLIFLEAKKNCSSIGTTEFPLINHIGRDTFFGIIKKYHRYGKSYRLLKQFREYSDLLSFRSRTRQLDSLSFRERLAMRQLYAVRGVSFLFGYYLV